jgi:hypothetical protein
MRELPKGVVALVKPVRELADNGVMFGDTLITKGQIKTTVFPGRMMEIYQDYPVATLYFDKVYQNKKASESGA